MWLKSSWIVKTAEPSVGDEIIGTLEYQVQWGSIRCTWSRSRTLEMTYWPTAWVWQNIFWVCSLAALLAVTCLLWFFCRLSTDISHKRMLSNLMNILWLPMNCLLLVVAKRGHGVRFGFNFSLCVWGAAVGDISEILFLGFHPSCLNGKSSYSHSPSKKAKLGFGQSFLENFCLNWICPDKLIRVVHKEKRSF